MSRLHERSAAAAAAVWVAGSAFAGAAQYIEGYTDKHSYTINDTISFHVSTDSPTFDVKVIRVEFPWWNDEPVIQELVDVAGAVQAVPADGWLGADWPVATTTPVAFNWETGDYLARFETEDGTVAYHPFYVRPLLPGSVGTIAYVGMFNTAAANNAWGGKNLYRSDVPGSPSPATRVSLERPFDTDGGRGATNWNRRLHCHLEEMGFVLEYITEWDIEQDPCLVEKYEVVVLAGYHQYATSRFFDALQHHHDRGGHLAFFSAGDLYWQSRYEDDGSTLVCYKSSAAVADPMSGVADCLVTTRFHSLLLNRPAETLRGIRRDPEVEHFMPTEFLVEAETHWIFAGTGVSNGEAFGSEMATSEQDTLWPASPGIVDILLHAFRDVPMPENPPPDGLTGVDVYATFYADTVDYGFPTGNGGMVFAAGTLSGWINSLVIEPGSAAVETATVNIVQGMLDNPPPTPGGTCSVPAFCSTLLVPHDEPTIQDAIDGPDVYDDILVLTGDYPERIDFHGRAITIRSEAGAESTLIDATGVPEPGVSVVTINSGEGADSILDGFTITGGNATTGGGLYIDGASPTVRNCIVEGNNASTDGGGAYVGTGSPSLTDNRFSNNTATTGGGLFVAGGGAEVANTLFCGNAPDDISGAYVDGGGNEFLAACPCVGDVDLTGDVGFDDLLAILSLWGPCDGCPEDINGDGLVGFLDLLDVLARWGPCP